MDQWIEQSRTCHWWFPYEGIVLASERPAKCEVDEQGRTHGGIEYSDGWGVWAWHGVRVNRYVVREPSRITMEDIGKETNVEVRRVLIERFGNGRYIKESGAKKIHSDDFGTLYRKNIPGDEDLLMVEVINSTPEPDGSFKNYILRVDPQLRPLFANNQFGTAQPLTARNAVASTFGLRGEEYHPSIQT